MVDVRLTWEEGKRDTWVGGCESVGGLLWDRYDCTDVKARRSRTRVQKMRDMTAMVRVVEKWDRLRIRNEI